MTEFGQFTRGGAAFPLPASTVSSFLKDADPALYYTIDYFQSVLNTYLNARVAAELAKPPAITSMSSVVAAVIPMDPMPFLQEQQFKFPLLAVYRKKETFQHRSVEISQDTAEWAVDYILPPMTNGQMERMSPLLRSVGQVLYNRIENMMDPGYASGAAIWTLAGVGEIKLTEASYGAYAGTGNLIFPAWRGKLTVKVVDSGLSVDLGLGPLTGIDNAEWVEGTLPADGTTEIDLVDTKKDFP